MNSPDAAPNSEPIVRMGDKLQVACPDCGRFGTHAGSCDWSLMRSGRAWVFYAEAVDIQLRPFPTGDLTGAVTVKR